MESLLQLKPIISVEKGSRNQFAREVLVVLFFNTLICTLVAFFLWLVFSSAGEHNLFRNWVYAQCIGQIICIGCLVYPKILEWKGISSKLVLGIGYPVIVGAGFLLGVSLAEYLVFDSVSMQVGGQNFWVIFLVSVCVSLFSIVFYSTWDHVTNLKMAAARESARASEARLSMLQAQVEPHMLFNTLSNLRLLIDSDPKTAQVMLDHLVEFLRATLAGSIHDSAPLKDEFSLLENYLSLMEIRMGERLSFDLNLPVELEDTVVPVLILQPLVENAIKHGLEPAVEGGHISVHARVVDQVVTVEVVDTGVGYDTNNQSMTSGFGLRSIRERLQSFENEADVLTIESPPTGRHSGSSVTIRFPQFTKSKPQAHQS